MHRSELHQYPSDAPVWGFVARLGAARFTGQVDLGSDERVRLFVADGRIAVAERPNDPPLGERLVAAGALTADQLQRGEVRVGATVSLARLFERVADADRDTVQVALGLLNDGVMEPVANQAVGEVAIHPLRHHASGAHLWDTELPPLPGAAADDADVLSILEVLHEAEAVAATAAAEPPKAAPEATPTPSPSSLPPLVLPILGTVGSRVAPPPEGAATSPGNAAFTPLNLDTLVLPQLASRPMSVGEITASQPVVKAEQEPATQEIWEMVDEMLGLPHTGETLVTAGPAPEPAPHADDKKSRGWLRGRRG